MFQDPPKEFEWKLFNFNTLINSYKLPKKEYNFFLLYSFLIKI